MNAEPLKTLKEVARQLSRPAHRIIHLCESGLVCPCVNSDGRGSVRRFSREDIFRIQVALELQEAGIQVPLIKPLMIRLDRLMEMREIQAIKHKVGFFDLVAVIRSISTDKKPVLAWLTPPKRVALVTPKFMAPSRPHIRVDLQTSVDPLVWRGVSVCINLTSATAGF